MANVLFFISVSLTFGLGWQTTGTRSVLIEARDGEPTLILTVSMEAALRRFDPQFLIRRLIDYPPYMWRRGCTWSAECAKALYRLNSREAPFAVIGDFNGDGILDVVMDGDNRSSGRRVVLMSSQQSFTATEIDSLVRISSDIESSRSNKGPIRGWEEGIDVGLSWAKPGTYRSAYESKPLVLKTDAFVVSYFEKASVLYYLRDGKWNNFTLSD